MASDKREDVAVLVSDIIRKDPCMIHVKDSALIHRYTLNSKHMIEIETEDKSALRYLAYRGKRIEDDFEGIKGLHLDLAKETDANYIFTSNFYENNGKLISIATPFQIISDKEIDFLVRNYYKDVPKEISEAALNLGIRLFDWYYSNYKDGKVHYTSYSDKEELALCMAFQRFVFTLPYEDQVLEENKKILSHLRIEDFTNVLAKEYSEGRYFQEYFKVISGSIGKYRKEELVSRIKALKRNKDYDIFLLKEGFVVGEKSIVDAYKEDTHAFIQNFKGLSAESQRTVIEELYKDSFVNPEAIKWLEENYTPLLREVGFLGGKQNDG